MFCLTMASHGPGIAGLIAAKDTVVGVIADEFDPTAREYQTYDTSRVSRHLLSPNMGLHVRLLSE